MMLLAFPSIFICFQYRIVLSVQYAQTQLGLTGSLLPKNMRDIDASPKGL